MVLAGAMPKNQRFLWDSWYKELKGTGVKNTLMPSPPLSVSQLAFESLAVIGNALTLLEVGQIAVCR